MGAVVLVVLVLVLVVIFDKPWKSGADVMQPCWRKTCAPWSGNFQDYEIDRDDDDNYVFVSYITNVIIDCP